MPDDLVIIGEWSSLEMVMSILHQERVAYTWRPWKGRWRAYAEHGRHLYMSMAKLQGIISIHW
jgi:hypothetical protein